jgi:hypothetical protein
MKSLLPQVPKPVTGRENRKRNFVGIQNERKDLGTQRNLDLFLT